MQKVFYLMLRKKNYNRMNFHQPNYEDLEILQEFYLYYPTVFGLLK